MSDPYPLPSYALSIWLSGDRLMLGVPGDDRVPNDRPHTLAIPLDRCGVEMNDWGTSPLATQRGWHALLETLRERAREGYIPKLGSKACPTQYNLDEIQRRITRYNSQGKAEITLEELDL